MQLAFHIFKKDMRLLWWHVLLGYALAAVALWPSGILSQPSHNNPPISILFAIVWGILIARATLQEPLAGERSYWLTRPIPRMQLLLAKALFLAVAVQLPILILDCVNLISVGYSPLAFAGGLAVKQLLLLSTLVLPLFAIATVSRSISQYVSIAIGVGIVILAFGNFWLFQNITWVLVSGMRLASLIALPALAVFVFRRRKVGIARIGLAVVGTAMLLFCFLTPYSTVFAVQEAVSPRPEPPARFEFNPAVRPEIVPDIRGWAAPGKRRFDLSLKIPEGFETVSPLHSDVTVTIPGGGNWKTARTSLYFSYSEGRTDFPTLSITVDDDDTYRQRKDTPVDVHARLYMTRVLPTGEATFPLPNGRASIEGLGVCGATIREDTLQLRCSKPLRDAAGYQTQVTASSGRVLSMRGNRPLAYNPISAQNVFSALTHTFVGGFSLGGVAHLAQELSPAELNGAKAHITVLEAVSHFHSDITIRGIRLGDYEVRGRF